MVEVMITNGGPHPASKWAEVTAKRILDIIEVGGAVPEHVRAKARLKLDLEDLLERHHDKVQAAERASLDEGGLDHLGLELDPVPYLDEVMADVQRVVAGTIFEEHFKTEPVRRYVWKSIGSDFCNVMHVERSWRADEEPGDARAAAYRDRFAQA